MKEVTVYEAEDGARFDSQAKCIQHEALIAECKAIESKLTPRPELGQGEWFQQDKDAFQAVRLWCLQKGLEHFGSGYSEAFGACIAAGDGLNPGAGIGRYMDDLPRPIRGLWWRVMCTEPHTAREYQQPYFAIQHFQRIRDGVDDDT